MVLRNTSVVKPATLKENGKNLFVIWIYLKILKIILPNNIRKWTKNWIKKEENKEEKNNNEEELKKLYLFTFKIILLINK